MTWYAIILLLSVIVYAELTRRHKNKKVTEDIKMIKREIKSQLETLSKAVNEKQSDTELVMPPAMPPSACSIPKRRVAARFTGNVALAEKLEAHR